MGEDCFAYCVRRGVRVVDCVRAGGSGLNYVSCFSGIEAASVASHSLGWEPVAFSEIDNFASAVLAHHYPKVPNLGDITKIDWSEYNGRVGLVCGGSPCFTAGHLVLTERGHVPIESVHVGDVVLTHKGNWKRVLRVGGKVAPTFILKGQGHWGIECTETHGFWGVQLDSQNTKRHGKYANIKTIHEPKWVEAKDLPGKFWTSHTSYHATTVPEVPVVGRERPHELSDVDLMYLCGLYVGDGILRRPYNELKNDGAVVLCVNQTKATAIDKRLPGYFSQRTERTIIRMQKNSAALHRWVLEHFGKLAGGKKMPAWLYGLPAECRQAFMDGYCLTDGTKTSNGFKINTVSRTAAVGLTTLAATLGYASTVCFIISKREHCIIEGRVVNERPYYQVSVYNRSRSSFIYEPTNLRCGLVRKFTPTGEEKQVYNIEVEDDHSYTIDGIICRNCQAFSVAGLRLSLGDPRGNLTLEYMRAVHAIKPKWVVWEQVPGVFSASGNPFGCFVAGLAGYDAPIEPPNGKWGNSGFLVAKDEGSYSLAWRILDAQHFGVPQRRRRIFLVGHLGIGCWWKPLEVLLERHRENGHPSQGRKAREEVAEDAGRCFATIHPRAIGRIKGGPEGKDWRDGKVAYTMDTQQQSQAVAIRTNQTGTNDISVAEGVMHTQDCSNGQAVAIGADLYNGALTGSQAATLTTNNSAGQSGPSVLTIHTNQTGANGIGVAEGVAHTLDCSNGQAVGYMETVGALCARDYKGVGSQYVQEGKDLALPMVMAHGQGGAEIREGQAPCLTCNHEAPIFFAPRSPDGQLRVLDGVCETLNTAQGGQRTECVAFTWQGGTESRTSDDMAGTLTKSQTEAVAFAQNQEGELRTSETMSTLGTTQNASGPATGKVVVPLNTMAMQGRPSDDINPRMGSGIGQPGDPCPTLTKGHSHAVQQGYTVRRITPVEAERLQGFPDSWTQIPYRGKSAELCPDGPRYKALGNSWAVPVARWVFERIDKVDKL